MSTVQIRELQDTDIVVVSNILYNAFNTFNESVSLCPEFPNVDSANELVRSIKDTAHYCIVAVDQVSYKLDSKEMTLSFDV
jgi:hypothetical protein